MDLRVFPSALRSNWARFTPSKSTCPPVGRSKKLMHRTRVDFPAPERPIIPYISPFSMVKDTSRTASTELLAVWKVLLTFFSSIIHIPPRIKNIKEKSGRFQKTPGHFCANIFLPSIIYKATQKTPAHLCVSGS